MKKEYLIMGPAYIPWLNCIGDAPFNDRITMILLKNFNTPL